MADRVDTSRTDSGVSLPGVEQPESRRNIPVRIDTIRERFEGQGHAARVYR